MSLKFQLLSTFREIFLPHYHSIEFRAKVFAAILLAKKEVTQEDYDKIRSIAEEIYPGDKRRIGVLEVLVREYINKSKIYKIYTLDGLLKEIDKQLKTTKRYAKKIDFEHLRRLICDSEDELIVQQRVYEFLVAEVKLYLWKFFIFFCIIKKIFLEKTFGKH